MNKEEIFKVVQEVLSEINVAEPTSVADPKPTGEPTGEPAPVVDPTSVADPKPTGEPAPVVDPTPTGEPTPVADPKPTGEPTPVADPTPVGEPTPVADPTPAVEPTPVTQEPVIGDTNKQSHLSFGEVLNNIQSTLSEDGETITSDEKQLLEFIMVNYDSLDARTEQLLNQGE